MELIEAEIARDILNMSEIDFDDETWLYTCPNSSGDSIKLAEWLSGDLKLNDTADELVLLLNNLHIESPAPRDNKVDSRTFTRPKKKCRPSIEQVYRDGKPLQFDLTQSSTTSYFDNIVANANSTTLDSFQNMSPPTLVNSICSSTFSNLMESSFIKNDPILREIRDTDYTDAVLMQESQPNLQSLTTSCSSLNSEAPEEFLKKYNRNNTFRKSLENATILLEQEDFINNTNRSFRKDQFLKKSDNSDNNRTLVHNNATITNAIVSDGTFTKNGGSTGSTDNLDECMSVSSNSSKESNTAAVFNNIEGINAIVAMQEKSLRQPTSTPARINFAPNYDLLENFSPIRSPKSDSEMSSSDDYKSAESAPPVNNINNGTLTKQKSLSNLLRLGRNVPNAKSIGFRGSQPSLKLLEPSKIQIVAKPRSNLNTMRTNLKGSYTNLKPVSANLPVAPPLIPPLPPPQVNLMARSKVAENCLNLRPQIRSNLPRPVQTGIPRLASRLPQHPRAPRPKAAGQPTGKTYGF